MRKIWERILAAASVLASKRVIVIDARLDKKTNYMAVGFWTTVESQDDQIVYLESMAKALRYEQLEAEGKVRKFNAQNN